MKKILMTCCAILMTAGCGNAQQAPETSAVPAKTDKKVLVVYYTRTNNTEAIAKEIQKQTGADLFKIETVTPYPSEYTATTEQAKKEIADGFKPAIKGKVNNIAQYDIVFVGSPVWWGTIAPAVDTFFSVHNLSGKMVIPFATHGGGGVSRTFESMKKAAPEATFLEGFVVSGSRADSSQKGIETWLKTIGVK